MSGQHSHLRRGPAQKPPRPLSSVSFAAPSDYENLINFLNEMKDEIDGGRVEDDLMRELVRGLTQRVGGVALIIRGQGRIEGSLGVRVERPVFSRIHYLRSVWNVVLPEARLTGHARSLLIAARKFADDLGRPMMIEELTPQINAPRARLVGRHFETAGALFLHTPA